MLLIRIATIYCRTKYSKINDNSKSSYTWCYDITNSNDDNYQTETNIIGTQTMYWFTYSAFDTIGTGLQCSLAVNIIQTSDQAI